MKYIVLLSGGLDSTVALSMMLDSGTVVEALTINYGQVHSREIDSARLVANHYGINHVVISVDPVIFGDCALTGTGNNNIPVHHAENPDETYVPARNTVLLALAAARAESVGADSIVIGANADDEMGYPDCRRSYLEAYRDVLQLGTVNHVWVVAPLLNMRKAEIVQYANDRLVPVELTWSCYRGGSEPCGNCGACESRGVVLS
jgi:7-cyano-7-deazaguanine synthase